VKPLTAKQSKKEKKDALNSPGKKVKITIFDFDCRKMLNISFQLNFS